MNIYINTNLRITTDKLNHLLIVLNGYPIFISEKDTAEVKNKKVKWFKEHEKERLVKFIQNHYYNYYNIIITHV